MGVATLAIAAAALAATHAGTERAARSSGPFRVLGSLDASGDPEPSVQLFPDGAENLMHWSMCTPRRPCRSIRTRDGSADPGPEPAGTVFKFTVVWQRHTYSSRLRWHGTLGVAAAPALSGRTRVGATVTGRVAHWTGGWGTEDDQLGIEACRTSAATGCVMLSGDQLQCSRDGCGSSGGVPGAAHPNRAVVGNWYTGWYLFALDGHLGDDSSELIGYASEASIPPWPSNPTVIHSRPYGPVAGPPAPQVRLLGHPQLNGTHVIVASARCDVTCRAWTTVTLIRTRVTSGQRVAWSADKLFSGSASLAVVGRIPPGRVLVTVHVGDGPNLTARSRIP